MNRSPIRYTFCDASFHYPVQCEHSLQLNLSDISMIKKLVFNNQIITGLLLLRTHGCKHCQTHGFTVQQNQQVNLFLISNCMQLQNSSDCRERSCPMFEVRFGTVRRKLMLFNIISCIYTGKVRDVSKSYHRHN